MTNITDFIQNVSPVLPHLLDTVIVRGEGAYIWDENDKRYIDFTSGIGVTNTGHCHPQVVEAIRKQAGSFIHAQQNCGYHKPMLNLIEALHDVLPEQLNTYFFANSGAEAVETAVKLARQATGRTNIIAFQWGFHGRTAGAMSLTASKTVYRAGYQPLPPGVFFAPYAYCYRCPKAEAAPEKYGYDRDCEWALDQVRFILKSQTAPEETAAMIVEPVLGEGGYVVPPARFLQGLRKICDEHKIILIIDEIQTGFGRTGKFFAFEHFDILPDILIMSKGIASGMPLSCIVVPRELWNNTQSGSHGGTYAGNAVACAAAAATIRVLIEEKMIENAAYLGETLLSRLKTLGERFSVIGDVRGLGLMTGVEFTLPVGNMPDTDTAKAIQRECLKDGLLLLTCGTYDNVIRWVPPLNIDDNILDEALNIFEQALQSAVIDLS